MDRRRALSSLLIFGVGSGACPRPAWSADNFPSRPVRIIVTSSAGGVQDVNVRRVAERLARSLGQPVVIDNRPGASGTIGTAWAARPRPMDTRLPPVPLARLLWRRPLDSRSASILRMT